MYNKIFKKIEEYKNICIFRHVRPDGDATFAQFALASFIKDNFKNKNVKICGNDEYDLLPYSYIPKTSYISNSLVFVLDTSNSNRIDGLDALKGDYIIKIDHHPSNDNYGNINISNPLACSTCEVLASIFYSNKKYIVSNKTATYLYSGILTDSNCFTTSNTTSDSLYYASRLTKDGKFDISSLNNYLFSKSINEFNSVTNFRKNLIINKSVGYVILDTDKLNSQHMSKDEAKNSVDEFKYINGLKIWAVFAEDRKNKLYDGSIRSKSLYVINDICSKYNGGGHKNACGVKGLTLKQVKALIKDLSKIV